jgi:hypothetical protein
VPNRISISIHIVEVDKFTEDNYLHTTSEIHYKMKRIYYMRSIVYALFILLCIKRNTLRCAWRLYIFAAHIYLIMNYYELEMNR